MKYILLWSSAFLSFFFYDHFLMKDLYNVFKMIALKTMLFLKYQAIFLQKEYNMWKDAIHPF